MEGVGYAPGFGQIGQVKGVWNHNLWTSYSPHCYMLW